VHTQVMAKQKYLASRVAGASGTEARMHSHANKHIDSRKTGARCPHQERPS
jgi:hypothetical protein